LAISKSKKKTWDAFSPGDKDRIVRMAWEDRTAFDAIEKQFSLTANEVVRFMRTQLEQKAFEKWRERANTQGQLKHEKKRPFVEGRFRCARQRSDGSTKGRK
jgi:uncharacterized protein (TIGR03643 family)